MTTMKPSIGPNTDIGAPLYFTVRNYKKSDLDPLKIINDQCFTVGDSDYWQPSALTNFPESQGAHVFILEQRLDGQPVIAGFIFCRTVLDEAELLLMGLGTPFRGKKLSGLLVEYMIDTLKNQNIKTIFLEVKETNNAAINLYKSRGFSQIGQRPNYYKIENNKDVNAIVYSLELVNL